MKNCKTLWLTPLLLAVSIVFLTAANPPPVVDYTTAGYEIGHRASDAIGFHGAAPTSQRSGSAQVAITDSTTGTAGTTAAAGTGVTTLTIPIHLVALTTSAADLVTAYTPGYRFKILSVSFATTKLGTGTSASQVLNLAIGSTPVTGGVVTITLAGASTGTDVLGKLSAGTAVTAANVGLSTDTISLKVAGSGTVFTAGDGVLLIKLQNMDTADTAASILRLQNELRATLVAKGLMKGS